MRVIAAQLQALTDQAHAAGAGVVLCGGGCPLYEILDLGVPDYRDVLFDTLDRVELTKLPTRADGGRVPGPRRLHLQDGGR